MVRERGNMDSLERDCFEIRRLGYQNSLDFEKREPKW
jgi:hypothetical protein